MSRYFQNLGTPNNIAATKNMFSAVKSTLGPYPLPNSRNKFVQEPNAHEQKLFNRSFDTATTFLNKSGNLKQTKLCLNKSWATKKDKIGAAQQDYNNLYTFDTMKKEVMPKIFFQLPTRVNAPTEKVQHLNKTVTDMPCVTHASQQNETVDGKNELEARNRTSNAINKIERNCLTIMGRVDFCFKIHKKYPEVNAIWDVYGTFFKKLPGKQRCEYIILLRNDSGGPVLQGIYYDFCNRLAFMDAGCNLRMVGRYIGENRLQIFKLQQMENVITDKYFTRIQNVILFALLQNEV